MPKTKTKRVGSDLKLARALKPAGKISQDDRRKAAKFLSGMGLSAPQKRVLMNKLAPMSKFLSSDLLKAGAASIKSTVKPRKQKIKDRRKFFAK